MISAFAVIGMAEEFVKDAWKEFAGGFLAYILHHVYHKAWGVSFHGVARIVKGGVSWVSSLLDKRS